MYPARSYYLITIHCMDKEEEDEEAEDNDDDDNDDDNQTSLHACSTSVYRTAVNTTTMIIFGSYFVCHHLDLMMMYSI